jgi:biopolymer transport protein ExbD
VRETTLFTAGLRSIIIEKQAWLEKFKPGPEGRDGLMLLIKATDATNYQTVIEVLDEAIINKVKKYALIQPEKEERDFVQMQK